MIPGTLFFEAKAAPVNYVLWAGQQPLRAEDMACLSGRFASSQAHIFVTQATISAANHSS